MNYEWRCTVCDARVTVERPVAEYNVPPRSDEANRGDNCIHPESWVKVYSSTVPFEMLRDKGVFHRTHFKRGT